MGKPFAGGGQSCPGYGAEHLATGREDRAGPPLGGGSEQPPKTAKQLIRESLDNAGCSLPADLHQTNSPSRRNPSVQFQGCQNAGASVAWCLLKNMVSPAGFEPATY